MLFNSFVFAGLFLPLCLLCFWLSPTARVKRGVLLAFSIFFYAYWSPAFVFLLLGLVGVAWACALAAERTEKSWPVWLASVLLLGTLGYFKYAGFLARVLHDLHVIHGVSARFANIALPLGISFIVFQALGYVIDVHRREFHAERSYSVTLLFKAFFPQLIAGPICRAHELIPQLKGEFKFDVRRFMGGIAIFCAGLFLKLAFADALAALVDQLFNSATALSRIEAWAAAIGFGFQIYADFWGYSSMAVGLALMLGVDIPVNFKLPYLATSIRDFWRRWHVTLSRWLRDYLYISLGGSRHGKLRTIAALLATMLLGGLWHGANYTFIIWGAIYGVALTVEHFLPRHWTLGDPEPTPGGVARMAIGFIYTMLIVMFAWVFFRAADVPSAMRITRAMVRGYSGPASASVREIVLLSGLLFVLQVPAYKLIERSRGAGLSVAVGIPVSLFLLLGAIVMGSPEAVPFIYFEF
jgi:D-alanyl-lipoteichoic acid acyltransferase DltB (MBOAT superfamily)